MLRSMVRAGSRGAALVVAVVVGRTVVAALAGLALSLVALGLAMAGRAALRLRGIWPDSALRGLRRDAEAVERGLNETGARQHV